jgi:hypothetical protein
MNHIEQLAGKLVELADLVDSGITFLTDAQLAHLDDLADKVAAAIRTETMKSKSQDNGGS